MKGRIKFVRAVIQKIIASLIRPAVRQIVDREITVFGDPSRLSIAPTARMVNTLFNTESGTISIGEYTGAGHNVAIITGAHDYRCLLQDRMKNVPQGKDIRIGNGVWLGTNSVILGPCVIGDHAVIAAGAVVTADVPPETVVAGIPARPIKTIMSAS